jgi:tetratricopeptide (TPR) repeat protein
MTRALTVIGILVALATPARAQPQPQELPVSDEARRAFELGVALLQDRAGPRYAEAYEAFNRAYAATPTPKILGNLGLCAMMLERDGEAIAHYERYLAEVHDADPSEVARIRRDLAELEQRSGTLIVELNVSGASMEDRRLPPGATPIVNRYEARGGRFQERLRAGIHDIEVQVPGRATQRLEVEIEPREVVRRTVTLERVDEPPEEAGISTPTVVFLSATGVLVVAAAITGGLALAQHGDFDAFESGGSRMDAEDVRSKGEKLNAATDVLIGGAILAGSFALGFGIRDAVVSSRASSVAFRPLIAPCGGGLTMTIVP